MVLRRPRRDVPASSLMPTYQYGIFMAVAFLSAVGLTVFLLASIIGLPSEGNAAVNTIVGISALGAYWLTYLGYKMTVYAHRQRGDD